MAHFARIENGIVREVLALNNDLLLDDSNTEIEEMGVAFLIETFGPDTEWVQTSYNAETNGFRGKYAGIGDTWDGTVFATPNSEETP